MAGHYPGILMTRPYRNKHTQICTPSLGTAALGPYSNGAVQIRVGLELAEVAFSEFVPGFEKSWLSDAWNPSPKMLFF